MNENGKHGLRVKASTYFNTLIAAGEPLWYAKVSGSPWGRAGIPDFLLCYAGRFGALELKRQEYEAGLKRKPRGKLSELQKREIAMIQRAQGIAGTAFTMIEVRAFIELLKV